MIKKVNHIGIAVRNLETAIEQYKKLGFTVDSVEELPEFSCKMAFLPCGETLIELIEPIGSAVKYFETKDEGLHHICYEVDDIHAAFDAVGKVLPTREAAPVAGAGNTRVFFVEPEHMCNVETEFAELPKE
jgi:Lactoylglutathione lyase and related lyases